MSSCLRCGDGLYESGSSFSGGYVSKSVKTLDANCAVGGGSHCETQADIDWQDEHRRKATNNYPRIAVADRHANKGLGVRIEGRRTWEDLMVGWGYYE